MSELRSEGLSLRAVADVINATGRKTVEGFAFYPALVDRILARTSSH